MIIWQSNVIKKFCATIYMLNQYNERKSNKYMVFFNGYI